MTPIVEGGDVVEPLRDRVLGRVVASDTFAPGNEDAADRHAQHAARREVGREARDGRRAEHPRAFADHLRVRVRRVRALLRSRSRAWSPRQSWAKRSASSPRSRSANQARSSRCVRSTSVVRHRVRLRSTTCRSRRPARLKFNNLKTVNHNAGTSRRGVALRRIVRDGRPRPRARALQGAVRRDHFGRRTVPRSRPVRSSPTGIRIPIRSSRKWPARCASSTSSTASPCSSRPTN